MEPDRAGPRRPRRWRSDIVSLKIVPSAFHRQKRLCQRRGIRRVVCVWVYVLVELEDGHHICGS
eukprot:5249-Eustigmatos_ZCMA.PRE.1